MRAQGAVAGWWSRFLRLPPLPKPAAGEELLRPSRRQFQFEIAGFCFKQLGALLGIAISIAFLRGIELPIPMYFVGERVFHEFESRLSEKLPDIIPGPVSLSPRQAIWILEGLAIGTFLLQLAAGAALLRLKFESRIYLVSDERVRLREGIFTIREQTFTVANIQNLSVRQGPIQGFLGIGDLEISTAGGGNEKVEEDGHSLHTGRLRSLDDPSRIRDRLRTALERHRHAGLGEAEDEQPEVDAGASLLAAAESFRDEARALRQAFVDV